MSTGNNPEHFNNAVVRQAQTDALLQQRMAQLQSSALSNGVTPSTLGGPYAIGAIANTLNQTQRHTLHGQEFLCAIYITTDGFILARNERTYVAESLPSLLDKIATFVATNALERE